MQEIGDKRREIGVMSWKTRDRSWETGDYCRCGGGLWGDKRELPPNKYCIWHSPHSFAMSPDNESLKKKFYSDVTCLRVIDAVKRMMTHRAQLCCVQYFGSWLSNCWFHAWLLQSSGWLVFFIPWSLYFVQLPCLHGYCSIVQQFASLFGLVADKIYSIGWFVAFLLVPMSDCMF